MKKVFEIVLVFIIFFGVYSFFDKVSLYLFKDLKSIWIVLISLVISALLLLLYKKIIHYEVKTKLNKDINILKLKVKNMKAIIEKKDEKIAKTHISKGIQIEEAKSSDSI